MDNYFRLILFFSLAFVVLLIYQAWMEDYGRPAVTPETVQQPTTTEPPQGPDISDVPADIPTAPPIESPSPTATPSTAADLIRVETDVLRLDISRRGGTIASAWLLDYAVTADDPENKFRLFKPTEPNLFVAQSGLIGGTSGQLPDHRSLFSVDQDSFALERDQDELAVLLTWSHPSGVTVRKRYRLTRGSYVIHLEQEVTNATDANLTVLAYQQLQRTQLVDPDASYFIYTYTGGVYYSPEDKYTRVSFDDMRDEKLDRVVTNGWIAMIQHYFMAAWIPPTGTLETFYTDVYLDSRYILRKISQPVTLPPGVSHRFDNRLFLGPKLQDTLAGIATGLELAVDYGWLTILAQPIFWLLSAIHSIVGNWGWAIIILTILIKLAFYPLSATSYKSMANMREVAPRLQALKDRYGDDKQRFQQAMMDLYKKEKINPLGGCLPILVQIPVFIALYWVLLESVELRHAPFALWINNLSSPDPFFVLPLIMGVSMFVQQKLNPPPPDPIQAKVLMTLPFVFTVFFAFFPAGLVLYWVVNNILSISQQWYIMRKVEQAKHRGKA